VNIEPNELMQCVVLSNAEILLGSVHFSIAGLFFYST